MKAEKLKQKAYRKIPNYVGGFWVEYHFNEKELKQYAAEVSREKLRDAFEQGYDHHNDPNKYYGFDEWMSKQQNK